MTFLRKCYRELGTILAHLFIRYLPVPYRGYWLKIPLLHGVKNGGYFVPSEDEMLDAMRIALIDKPDEKCYFQPTVLDVGCNVGLLLTQLRSFNTEATYIGFDANPMNCVYTNLLIDYNDFKYSYTYPIGLSDSPCSSSLSLRKRRLDDPGAGMVDENYSLGGNQKLLSTFCVSGDEFLKARPCECVRFIKVDVEGYEPKVLGGLLNTISTYRPHLYLEVHTNSSDYVISLMESLSYRLIIPATREILSVHEITKFEMGNYWLVPKEDIVRCTTELGR